jgi:hypothetical protein
MLTLFPSVDPYLAAAMTFANSALGGAGTVMVHHTRAQGLTDLTTEAAEVARAARDVGVRAGFAVSMKDRNPLVYGGSDTLLAALPPEARPESTSVLCVSRRRHVDRLAADHIFNDEVLNLEQGVARRG